MSYYYFFKFKNAAIYINRKKKLHATLAPLAVKVEFHVAT